MTKNIFNYDSLNLAWRNSKQALGLLERSRSACSGLDETLDQQLETAVASVRDLYRTIDAVLDGEAVTPNNSTPE